MLRPAELAPEAKRSMIAFFVSLLGIPLGFLASLLADDPRDAIFPVGAVVVLLVIDIFCVVYVVLTARAFRHTDPQELAPLLAQPAALRDTRIGRAGSDGPGIGIQYAGAALVAAVILPRLDQLVPDGVLRGLVVGLSVVAVLACWVLLHVSYAVHYARLHTRIGGLAFPGEEQPAFSDYLYFSLSVATSVGATDVAVTSRRLRRVVAGHSVLSFVFNTVILAIAIASLAA